MNFTFNRRYLLCVILISFIEFSVYANPLLGLPDVPIPKDNSITPEKVALGDKLFHDVRFSADGKVSCSTCHDRNKGFTDNLKVSTGFKGLKGTRNSPTVINSAFMKSMFWDGRDPSLEVQSKGPPINPVEGGLHSHEPIINIITNDTEYKQQFTQIFGISSDKITMDEVSKAIATFERTIVSGNSDFDKFQYGNDKTALNDTQLNGLDLFRNKARCVSCHTIEQTQALFTDNRFHNIGIGFKNLQNKEIKVIQAFNKTKTTSNLDETVLSNANVSELGRLVVTNNIVNMGEFKTPTLRNIEITAPYMHDGSLATLKEVIEFYNNGGRVDEKDALSPFLSGGIRPLNLTEEEITDIENFLKSLTSPQYKRKGESS